MTVRGTALRLLVAVAAAVVAVTAVPWVPTTAAHAAPQGLFAGDLAFVLSSVTPGVVTSSSSDLLQVSGTVTNTADVPLTDLIVRFQRGAALDSEEAVAREIVEPSQPDRVIAGDWQPFGDPDTEFAAGAQRPFALSAPIAGDFVQGLQITEPGVYPVMANVNGIRDVDGVSSSVRLGELHLLVTVTSIPRSAGVPSTTRPADRSRVPVGVTWPISSVPHRTVGGAFTSEALAAEISQGGALAANLDALAESGLPAANTVFTIDPMLLDELDTMARGYRVVTPGAPATPLDPVTETSVDTRSPGSTPAESSAAGSEPTTATTAPTGTTAATATSTDAAVIPGTVAGTNAAAAATFLERLRAVTESSPVVVLPYSDPDTVQLTAAGQGTVVRTLRTRGIQVAERVLQRSDLITDIGLPPGGAADTETVEVYQRIGFRALLLSRDSVSGTPQLGGVGRVAGVRTSLPTTVGDQNLQPLLAAALDPPAGTSGAGALNAAVALLVARSDEGSSRPVLQLTGRQVDVGGLDQLARLVAALSADGVTTGADVRGTTRGAPATADLQAELPAGTPRLAQQYLARLGAARAFIDQTATVIAPEPSSGGSGSELVASLKSTVDSLASASLQQDPAVGDAVLGTVEESLQRINAGVTIRRTAGSYTLASADSPLLLTVLNQLPFPVRVRLTSTTSLASGLTLTLPDAIDLGGKSSQQISIPASVSRAGNFSIQVQLATPGNTPRPWGEAQRIQIRSNAYGPLTLILVVSAGGVLFLMVGLRLLQRVRGRGRQQAPEPAGESIAAMAQEASAPAARAAETSDAGRGVRE